MSHPASQQQNRLILLVVGTIAAVLFAAFLAMNRSSDSELPPLEPVAPEATLTPTPRPVAQAATSHEPETEPHAPRERVTSLHVRGTLSPPPGTQRGEVVALVVYPGQPDPAARHSLGRFPGSKSWVEHPVEWTEGFEWQFEASGLPPSDRVMVVAWDRDMNSVARVYRLDPPHPKLDAGILTFESPTGLNVSLESPLEGHTRYRIRLKRQLPTGTNPHELARKYFLWRAAPDVFRSYDWPVEESEVEARRGVIEESLFARPGEPLQIAPMLPDETVRLSIGTLSGSFGTTGEIKLTHHRVRDVAIDVSNTLPAEAIPCVELEGRIVDDASGQPIPDARVILADVELAFEEVMTDSEGRFRFECVPAPGHEHEHDSVFRVVLPPGERGVTGPPRELRFALEPEEIENNRAETEWRIPPVRWIEVELTSEQDRELRQHGTKGFPIQLIERWDEDEGRWVLMPPVDTRYTADGFAVATYEPGRIRAAVALSALEIKVSEPVDAAGSEYARKTRLASEHPSLQTLSLQFLQQPGGYPIEGLDVFVQGLPVSRPGHHAVTDDSGVVTLPPLNVSQISVRAVAGQDAWEFDVAVHPDLELVELSIESP